MVGGATLELGVLVLLRKQAEQVKGSKQIITTPPWPLQQLLPPGSCSV